MIQITFNNKKSYTDMNVTIDSFTIQPPSKKKIKEEVPFMNSSYDFSTIGSSGEQFYNNRIIKVKFNLNEKNRSSLYNKYSEVLSWLLDSGQSQLIFSDMFGFYYLAEVENAPSFETIIKRAGIMEVEFIAEPFKTSVNYEGDNIWDAFNFEIDTLQNVEFDVVGSSRITLTNEGRLVTPTITTNSSMTIKFNNKTYNLTTGTNKLYGFKLSNGSNSITITGTGHIKFLWRREML